MPQAGRPNPDDSNGSPHLPPFIHIPRPPWWVMHEPGTLAIDPDVKKALPKDKLLKMTAESMRYQAAVSRLQARHLETQAKLIGS